MKWPQRDTVTLRRHLSRQPAPRAAGTSNPGLRRVSPSQRSAAATPATWPRLRIHAAGEMRCHLPAFRTRIASCSVPRSSVEMPTTHMTRTHDEPAPLPYLPLVPGHGGRETEARCPMPSPGSSGGASFHRDGLVLRDQGRRREALITTTPTRSVLRSPVCPGKTTDSSVKRGALDMMPPIGRCS